MLGEAAKSIAQALCAAGLEAREKYTHSDVRTLTSPTVFVGVSGAKAEAAGMGHYLGTKRREDGTHCELYGLRCEVSLALDIYAPARTEHCESACAKVFDEALFALGEMGALTLSEVSLGEGKVQDKSGLYMCPCRIKGAAYLVAESEDGAEFTDFVLKGVLKNER